MKPVVLITGASQGIGAAIAREFAAAFPGCRLALVARNMRNLRAVAKSCEKRGAKAAVFGCDVTDEAAVNAMAAGATKAFGRVDVLVNNAGVFECSPFLEMEAAQFDRVVAASLRSTFLVSRAVVPGMVKRGRGDVFNMSSIAGLSEYPQSAAYCAAKFGVTGLTKVMREELKDKGVRVCSLHPGATWTPSWASSGFKGDKMMAARDIAQAVVSIYRLDRRAVVEGIVLRPQTGDVG